MLDTYDFNNDVWLCHSFGGQCYNITAFQPAINVFKEIQTFLDANPSEVITIFLEDYTASGSLPKVFNASGLMKYWFPVAKMPKSGGNWPLLKDMISQNQRLLVFTSKKSKEASEGIAYEWNYVVENQYGDEGMVAGKCPNRAESPAMDSKSQSLVLMNFFTTNPSQTGVCGNNSAPLVSMLTTRRPKSRRHQLPISSGAMEEADDHRPSSSTGRPFLSGLCAAALRRKPLGAHASAAASGEGLVRQLGVLELVLLGIGASIGAGIFVVTGTVARDTGPGVTISFVLAGAACVLNALCYAELASRFPAVVGGAYLYTYAVFNEITAFLVFTQLMVDYHIGAASIARSLASYFIQFLELLPFLKGHIPSWIGHGEEFFGGVVSINILAPILLILLTAILCYGVKESSAVNTFMTTLKIVIVIVVVFAGVFEVDVTNWSPFMPNGFKSVVTGATVVFFAYVGFDAVANSAEEAKRPQRDLPIGILGSLLACVLLYVAVCLVITGMVPYTLLGEDAPLAEAFAAKGLKFVTVLISIGAVAGLTTTLLVGLYVQSRLYLGLGRDGLLPPIFAKIHPTRHTPLHSQIWVGCVAAIMAGLFNVHSLSHILSVGTLTGYSVVSACVITLRWNDKATSRRSLGIMSIWQEGVLCLVIVAFCGFIVGLCYRYDYAIAFTVAAFLIAVAASFALQFRQVYVDPPGFSCPGVPLVPVISVFFNMVLFAQLHEEAWYRFVILSLIAVGIYAGYGQYNAAPSSSDHHSSIGYHGVPSEAP